MRKKCSKWMRLTMALLLVMSVVMIPNLASAKVYHRDQIKNNGRGGCDIISIKGNVVRFKYWTNDPGNDKYFKKIRIAKLNGKTKYYKAVNINCDLKKSSKKAALSYYKQHKKNGWCSFYIKNGVIANYIYGEESYVG